MELDVGYGARFRTGIAAERALPIARSRPCPRTLFHMHNFLSPAGPPDIADRRFPNRVADVHDMRALTAETRSVIHARMNTPTRGVRTGIEAIDKLLITLQPGGLYLLVARPGSGRTAFALHLVREIVKHDPQQRVIYISLDHDRVALMAQFVASVGRIPLLHLAQGTLHDSKLAQLDACFRTVAEWPLEVIDPLDLNIDQLSSIVADRLRTPAHAPQFVVVDHLDAIQGDAHAHGEDDTYENVRRLKIMALELQLPVLVIVPLPGDLEEDGANDVFAREAPELRDLRRLGRCDRAADAVLFLHHDPATSDLERDTYRSIVCTLAMHRHGPTGRILARLHSDTCTFNIPAPEADQAGRVP